MSAAVENSPSLPRTSFLVIDNLQNGWSTRSYPHRLRDGDCAILDNFTHVQDNIWTVRAGNINYGSSVAGATGSGLASKSGYRFYFGSPEVGQLLVHSGTHIYKGNDGTGAFTSINAAASNTQHSSFDQMYDPDNPSGAAITCFITDGSRVPQYYDGTNFGNVQSGYPFLPNGVNSGTAIKPTYVLSWNYNLVYANEPTDPCAVWISDALRPERFTGTALIDSTNLQYFPYYPGGRNAKLGIITGLATINQYLVVFFTNGVVIGVNTGSYGTFQYVWYTLSSSIGCTAPQSIVTMDNQICFFGGYSFYATDALTIRRITPNLPSLYSQNNSSGSLPEIANITTVSGCRFNQQIKWSYQSAISGASFNDRVVTFDTDANGGWNYYGESGGTWDRSPSGMPMAWGYFCNGPGDTHQFFWGNGNADQIAQFNPGSTGGFTDFGSGIQFELRTKAYSFDIPLHPKSIYGIYPILVFSAGASAFDVTLQPYAIFDNGALVDYTEITATVGAEGTTYGSADYGTFLYESGQLISQVTDKSYPDGGTNPRGNFVAVGVTGQSTNSFNIIGFVIEVEEQDVEA